MQHLVEKNSTEINILKKKVNSKKMLSFGELHARTRDGKIKQIKIPDISFELKPQFPSVWFNQNLGARPSLVIPQSNLTLEQLERKIGKNWANTNLDEAMEYLFLTIPTLFNAELDEDWSSYGVTIGMKGATINPFDLFNVTRKAYQPSQLMGSINDIVPPIENICNLLSVYRFSLALKMQGEYKNVVLERMSGTFSGHPFKMGPLSIAVLPTKAGWLSDDNYRKVIAGVDMFFNKFPGHEYAPVKVATLPSRNKDCGGIIALRDLAKYIGRDVTIAVRYVFDGGVAEEIMKMADAKEEEGKADSYFHYFREMGFSQKSPYSSSANPKLYNFVHSLGTLLGIKRSINARLFSTDGLINIVNLAAFVAAKVGKRVEAGLHFAAKSELEAMEGLENAEENDDNSAEYIKIYDAIEKAAGELPPEVIAAVRETLSRVDAPRENTIGAYIKSIL